MLQFGPHSAAQGRHAREHRRFNHDSKGRLFVPVSPATVRRLRRAVLALLAVASTLLAVVLIVHALAPDGLATAPTPLLVAILALLLLPACTIGAWAWDRSLRRRLASVLADDDRAASPRAREHPAGRARPHAAPSSPTAHEPTRGTPIWDHDR